MLVDFFIKSKEFERFVNQLKENKTINVKCLPEDGIVLLALGLNQYLKENVFLLTSSIKTVKKIQQIYENFIFIDEALKDSTARILQLLKKIDSKDCILVSEIKFLDKFFKYPVVENFFIKVGDRIAQEEFKDKLTKIGYENQEILQEGCFWQRGFVLDLSMPLYQNPIRIEFEFDKIVSIREIGKNFFSIRKLKELKIPYLLSNQRLTFGELLKNKGIFLIEKENAGKIQGFNLVILCEDEGIDFGFEEFYFLDFLDLIRKINSLKQDYKIFIYKDQYSHLKDLLCDKKVEFYQEEIDFSFNFTIQACKAIILSETHIFRRRRKRQIKESQEIQQIEKAEEVKEGDFVVHIDHGIGIYRGLVYLEDKKREYILVEYAGGDRLYIPSENLDLLYKYTSFKETPQINRLSDPQWKLTTQRAKKSAQAFTKKLISLYKRRAAACGFSFSKDTELHLEFYSRFPYQETDDQLKAIWEVFSDLESSKVTDRVVCGDVGYGKTEVGVRAAFKVIFDAKQVVWLCATTVLARQHYERLKDRFGEFGIKVGLLTRETSNKTLLKEIEKGEISLIIGTHRVLSKDVSFKDLGLLIIDDEHKFGVRAKEKLKEDWVGVDTLYLSATPIPRTLYMTLVKIKDISLIETPPPSRREPIIYIGKYDKRTIKEAIQKELERGGGIFYVFNRISQIYPKKQELYELLGGNVIIEVAHAKLHPKILANIMQDFINQKIDILLATTIIEAGIDIPSANTIIIEGAENFGLSNLYQLRGRVGRADKEAYVYLFYSQNISGKAKKRLLAVKKFSRLSSGYKVALKDLEQRGAGRVFGIEQSGILNDVGFELYSQFIKEAIEGQDTKNLNTTVNIDVDVEAFIPSWFIPSCKERFLLYKELAKAKDPDEILLKKRHWRDKYGKFPKQMENYIKLLELKKLAQRMGVKELKLLNKILILKFIDGVTKKYYPISSLSGIIKILKIAGRR